MAYTGKIKGGKPEMAPKGETFVQPPKSAPAPEKPKGPNVFDRMGYGTRTSPVKPVGMYSAAAGTAAAAGIAGSSKIRDDKLEKSDEPESDIVPKKVKTIPITPNAAANTAPQSNSSEPELPKGALDPTPLNKQKNHISSTESDEAEVPSSMLDPKSIKSRKIDEQSAEPKLRVPTIRKKSVPIDPETGLPKETPTAAQPAAPTAPSAIPSPPWSKSRPTARSSTLQTLPTQTLQPDRSPTLSTANSSTLQPAPRSTHPNLHSPSPTICSVPSALNCRLPNPLAIS